MDNRDTIVLVKGSEMLAIQYNRGCVYPIPSDAPIDGTLIRNVIACNVDPLSDKRPRSEVIAEYMARGYTETKESREVGYAFDAMPVNRDVITNARRKRTRWA